MNHHQSRPVQVRQQNRARKDHLRKKIVTTMFLRNKNVPQRKFKNKMTIDHHHQSRPVQVHQPNLARKDHLLKKMTNLFLRNKN
jgi:hypothetical protein